MRIKIRWAYPSVLCVVLAFAACRQPSNFEGGDKGAVTEQAVMMMEPPPLDRSVPPPPPPPQSPQIKFVPPKVTEESLSDGEATPQKIDVLERKIIKTGDVRFKTHDLQKTRQAVLNAVNAFKGYVSEEGQTGNGVSSEMHLTVRIPAPLFDSLLVVIGSNAEYFDSKNIHTEYRKSVV